MSRSPIPRALSAVAAGFLLATLLATTVQAESACSSSHLRARFHDLHSESATSNPFYVVEEPTAGTAPGSFGVIMYGDSCGEPISFTYGARAGSATPPADFDAFSDRAERWVPFHGTDYFPGSFPVKADTATEAVAESIEMFMSEPVNVGFDYPTVPMYIVDTDGEGRAAFGGGAVTVSESDAEARIPVFRAGSGSSPETVTYTIIPGPGAGATPGADLGGGATGTVTFEGARVKSIKLPITNDAEPESDESVTITLSGPGVVEPSSTTLTIKDNEETTPPLSRFHHPRNGLRYKRADHRLREMHVFTSDQGGSRVARAELALRKNLKNGNCAWWTGKDWATGGCGARHWINLPSYEPDFYYYRIGALRPSVRSRIKDYTAYARATDHAGNVESVFQPGRNASTFEVRRAKKKRR